MDGLTKRGFKLTNGPNEAGFPSLMYQRAGGYYFGQTPLHRSRFIILTLVFLVDDGASQFIIDGKIGLKNGTSIKEFTKTGLKFEDDSTLDADLIVFATGIGDPRVEFKKIIGEELCSKMRPIWGLDSSGEPKGVWRDIGIENLWSMMGNLQMCRYHSRHVALREFFFSLPLSPLFVIVGFMVVDQQKLKP